MAVGGDWVKCRNQLIIARVNKQIRAVVLNPRRDCEAVCVSGTAAAAERVPKQAAGVTGEAPLGSLVTSRALGPEVESPRRPVRRHVTATAAPAGRCRRDGRSAGTAPAAAAAELKRTVQAAAAGGRDREATGGPDTVTPASQGH